MKDKKTTPWHTRLLLSVLWLAFALGFPFAIYRFGNFLYADDFFWQSDGRVYLLLALVALYVVAIGLLLAKLASCLHDAEHKSAPTGLRTSLRALLNHNRIEDSPYFDGKASPTRIRRYADKIVTAQKRKK